MALCTLLFIDKVKAGHTNDIEECLTNYPGRGVVDFPQTVFQPAERDSMSKYSVFEQSVEFKTSHS